jgi:cAMP-dependent protein kinase regulator
MRSPTAVDSEKVRTLKGHATDLVSKGELEAAVAVCLSVLEVLPCDVFALELSAELLARLGQRDRAIAHYQVLVGKHASEGHLMRAIAMCQLILQLDPEHVETQATLADLFAERDSPRAVRVPETSNVARTSAVDPTAFERIPLFSDLGRETFVSLVDRFRMRHVRDGETILEEGEAGSSMYAIARGAVRVIRQAEGREARVVAEMCEGEFFGEMSLLSGAPRFATVVAASDGELLELGRSELDTIARKHPTVGETVTRFYKERLLANVFRASPIFAMVSETQRPMLADVLHVAAHAEGTLLLEQGQPGKGFFMLLRGRCEVFHRSADGREVQYPPLSEGDVFGELSLLQDGNVTANVRTATPCVVLSMAQEWFDELLLTNTEVRTALYSLASERFRRTRELVFREELEKCLI